MLPDILNEGRWIQACFGASIREHRHLSFIWYELSKATQSWANGFEIGLLDFLLGTNDSLGCAPVNALVIWLSDNWMLLSIDTLKYRRHHKTFAQSKGTRSTGICDQLHHQSFMSIEWQQQLQLHQETLLTYSCNKYRLPGLKRTFQSHWVK